MLNLPEGPVLLSSDAVVHGVKTLLRVLQQLPDSMFEQLRERGTTQTGAGQGAFAAEALKATAERSAEYLLDTVSGIL